MQQTDIAPDITLAPETLETTPTPKAVAISIVVPVMNEQESGAVLFEKLSAHLDSLGKTY